MIALSPGRDSVRQILAIPQHPHVWPFLSRFQTDPTKLNPLPLMFHPISPGLSGTDGKTNLSENAATRPVQMHENTSDLRFDTQEAFWFVHNAVEF